MKSHISLNSKIFSLLWTVLIGASLVYSFFYINELDLRSGEQWDRYYSVFADDVSSLEKLFLKENIPFLSYSRSFVSYNDISNMKSLSLEEITGRFSSADPRLDPYMRKVDQLFSAEYKGEVYNIIYVEKDAISLWGLYVKLFRALPSGESFWSISGFEPLKRLLPLCLFLFLVGTIMSFSRGSRWKSAAALLGWIPLIYLFGYAALILAMVYYYFILKNRSIVYLFTLIITTALFLYYSQNLNHQFLLFFSIGLFSLSLLFSKETVLMSKKETAATDRRWKAGRIQFRKPEHQLFSPVPIVAVPVRKQTSVTGGCVYLKTIIISFIVLAGMLSFFSKPVASYNAPLPETVSGLEWNLLDTGKTSVVGALLAPADYVTHLAFQEGFLYGSDWSYPHQDTPLLYPVFSITEKIFSKSYEIIADYSQQWFEERVLMLENDNPATLLFSTDSPGYVIKKMNHRDSSSFTLLNFSFSVLILLLIIFSNGKKHINISLKVRKKLLRRNEQVA